MAIDTETKRKSIAALGNPWLGCVVVPTGGFDQADRQVIGYSYSGILASNPAPVTFLAAWAANSTQVFSYA